MFLAVFSAFAGEAHETGALPSASDILTRLAQAETTRSAALRNYTALRRYVLTNKRFDKRAEVLVRIDYRHPGAKQFTVLSENGPALLRTRVLRRMLDAEAEGSSDARRPLSRISADNYSAELAGTQMLDGRLCHVLRLSPKSRSPYLIRGQAWVDATEFAVARLEGVLVKTPSFWTRETRIDHRYEKHGDFWLPASDRSSTDVVFFGKSEVAIDCFEYKVNQPAPAVTAAGAH